VSLRERLPNDAEFIWSDILRNVHQEVLLWTVNSFFGKFNGSWKASFMHTKTSRFNLNLI
jgi:hypothetical protein